MPVELHPSLLSQMGQSELEQDELAGLDALEMETAAAPALIRRFLTALWPKAAALVIALLAWQVLVWSRWKPEYALPGPATVFPALADVLRSGLFWSALGTTIRRALSGFGLSVVIGTLLGIAVTRSSHLRRAVGSLITGLQTMPSITWFPLAILLFKLSEGAILFVVLLGATPSIANGMINGVDHIPPLLLRAGTVLGAKGWSLLRWVVLPAALPGYFGGLKQGWAFAWRSLMAGELLVIIGKKPSLGVRIDFARQLNDTPLLIAYMIVILVIGILVDTAFGQGERRLRRRRGLVEDN